MDKALQLVVAHAEAGTKLRAEFFASSSELIVDAACHIALSIARGGKILLAGNGGSAADAQHWAGEFTGRFLMDRPSLPAVALTTDTSVLTAIGNDFGFHLIFAKQVQALGRVGDVFLGVSTSGNSPNIIEALRVARERNLTSIGITGKDGGEMARLCDFLIAVPHTSTPLIQEVHIAVGHALCALTDYFLFENVAAIQPLLQRQNAREVSDKD